MSGSGFSFSVASHTHPGLRRETNEDSLIARDPLFLVADGVGGHDAGDVASSLVITAFQWVHPAQHPATLDSIETSLAQARSSVASLPITGRGHAGSTLAGLIRITHQDEPHWYIVNVGDSRVYLLRDMELSQLTTDHSLPHQSNVITRAIGAEDDRHDSWLLPIEVGVRFLICSDGLTDEISEHVLTHTLSRTPSAESAAEELLHLALQAGGRDNISLIILDIQHAPSEDLESTIEQ